VDSFFAENTMIDKDELKASEPVGNQIEPIKPGPIDNKPSMKQVAKNPVNEQYDNTDNLFAYAKLKRFDIIFYGNQLIGFSSSYVYLMI
jgi:hypothetical protein